jgi:AcrR family transcriptional regulator
VPDPAARRLPRGRHGLSRDEVAESQRSRMLRAMALAMTEKGYVGTSVADVLARAGVSRETFYQQFGSKLECFLAAFDAAGELLMGRLGRAELDDGETPLERFDRAFSAYVDVLTEQPALARVFLVEVYAAGPEALARRAQLHARIVDRMADLLSATTAEDRFECQLLVAGVGSLVTGPLVAGDVDALRGLRSQVVDLVGRTLVGKRSDRPGT